MKNMLLLLGESASCGAASIYARRLARAQNANLTGISGVDLPFIEASMPGTIGGAAYHTRMETELKAHAEEARSKLTADFCTDCAADGISAATRAFAGDPCDEVTAATVTSDLVITGHDVTFRGTKGERSSDTLAHLLNATPRPVLVCPDIAPAEGDVLVAYDGSLPAMRALQLFVLLGAWSGRRVHVSSIESDIAIAERRAEEAASYLRLHGYEVELHPISSPDSAADVIQVQAAHSRIELLVMGAYGHRGLKELFFGSTTESIVGAPQSCIFLYH